MKRLAVILVCAGFLALGAVAAHAYPQNYLSAKLGASVSTDAKIGEGKDPNVLLSDDSVSAGIFYFSKKDQAQVFLVDLGQVRTFDRVHFGTGNAGGDRCAKQVKIQVSNEGPRGPFRTVFEKTDLGLFQVLRLPLVEARWVKFDLGKGSTGALVHKVRIYKGYEHPRLVEVTKLLHERIKPDLPGLEKFYAAADKGDWKKACSELRAYYAEKRKPEDKPNPDYDTQRAQDVLDGNMDYAGIPRTATVPIDWSYQKTVDWYEHKNFLNRGSAIGVPTVAYYHTGDKKWAKLFRDVFYDWVDANPKPEIMRGARYPTWRTLDSAGRIGWVAHVFPLTTVGEDIDDELWANHLFSIWEHADYLKNDDFTGGNWLANVTSAVMGVAMQHPEFKDRKIWLAYGKDGFERNVLRDVHPDGKEFEDAPGYVCFAYSAMLDTLKALDEAGLEVDAEARRRMDKVQDFLGAVTQPDGNMPNIGDWGGGEPYPLPRAMEYFKRDDIKYILTKGEKGKMPEKASVNFPHGQWSIMRTAYDEKPYESARHLVFKSSSGAHGHNDILNITAYGYGRELLIDPGTKSYEQADSFYSKTDYHNTICIDGKSHRRAGKTEKWASNDGLDYVLGLHTGYKDLTHRRDVLFVKPDYWIVHDDIQGEGKHTYDQNWHFRSDAAIAEDPATKVVYTNYLEDGNLLMVPVDTNGLKSEIKDFFTATVRMGGVKGNVPSKGWKYSRSGSAPQVFDVVLYPYCGLGAPSVSVKRLPVEGADPIDVTALEITVDDSTDYVFVSRAGAKQISIPSAKLAVDGEIVVVRLSNGKPVRVSGMKVKSVSLDNKELVTRDEAEDVDVAL